MAEIAPTLPTLSIGDRLTSAPDNTLSQTKFRALDVDGIRRYQRDEDTATQFGLGTIAQSPGAVAIGAYSLSVDRASIALGLNSRSDNQNCIAIGEQCRASGYRAISLGTRAYTSKPQAIAIGVIAQVTGESGIAIGYQASAAYDNSIALGPMVTTTAANEMRIGDSAGTAIKVRMSDTTRWDSATQTTVGAAGGASALPATPTRYLVINIAGTEFVVPYYAKS